MWQTARHLRDATVVSERRDDPGVRMGRLAQRQPLGLKRERPPIAPHRDDLRSGLAEVLAIAVDAMSVKATRPEGLGLMGDGVGCMAVAVIA